MNIRETFSGQLVCIANLSTGFTIRSSNGGNLRKFKDTCEYYFGVDGINNKFFKNDRYTAVDLKMASPANEMIIDCRDVVIQDVLPMVVDQYIEFDEDGADIGAFVGVFDYDEIYKTCDCYEDGWELIYFQMNFCGFSKERFVSSLGRSFEIELEPVKAFLIDNNKIHVLFNINEVN